MAFSFRSIGHFLAVAFTSLTAAEPTVEGVTAIVPGAGASIVAIEKASFAVLGEIASLLTTGTDATVAKLTDAGFDQAVIAKVQDLLKDVPMLVSLAKAL